MLLALVSLDGIAKVALFLAVLSVLVVLHELGHFLFARLFGVRVLEFAVGMGPKIVGWRSERSGTLYSLRALPLGGYCAMHGEDNKTSEGERQREFRQTLGDVTRTYDDDNFQAKGPWQRLTIIAAGPIANFVLAFVILLLSAIFFGVQGQSPQPLIGNVVANSPAARAGLKAGDRIVRVNGQSVPGGDALITIIHGSLGKTLRLAYERNGITTEVSVRAAACPPPIAKNSGCIGFNPVFAFQHVPLGTAIRASVSSFAFIGQQVFGSLALLVSHPRQYGGQISGVVGMAQASMVFQSFGWGYYLGFAALISFALGVFNFLPIPALDGGRAAFIIAELIRGKPVDPEKEALVHITGFAVLIALMLAINFYNVLEIYQGKGPF